MKPLIIGNIEAEIPVIQGGMGIGVSRSSLAGAVAACGGVGVISTAQIGYDEPDFDSHTLEANLRALRKHIALARKISGGRGLLAVNIMAVTKQYGQYVRTAAEEGIDLIITGAGLPVDLPKYAFGFDVKLAPIVSSEKAANVICRYWERRYQYAPDLLVIEGPLAGGHLGFKKEQLLHMDLMQYDDEIRRIMAVAQSYGERLGKRIPVAVAGGVDTAARVRKCMDMGADAVQAATLFVMTEECDAHPNFKQAYIDAKESDIAIIDSPVGMPGRAVRNQFIKNVEKGIRPEIHCRGCMAKCDPKTTKYCITDALIRAVKGDTANGLVFCGANAAQCKKIRTVREVLELLTADL